MITDEQSSDVVPRPIGAHNYMINVANYTKSVGFGKWIRINGWSDSIARYIATMGQL